MVNGAYNNIALGQSFKPSTMDKISDWFGLQGAKFAKAKPSDGAIVPYNSPVSSSTALVPYSDSQLWKTPNGIFDKYYQSLKNPNGMIGKNYQPWKSGDLTLGKFNVGKLSRGLTGAYQVMDALGGLGEMSNLNEDADSLTSSILASAAGNPLLSSYLTSDDLALLGKIQRGTYDATADLGDATSNLGNLLGGAASGAMTGIVGGIPGMLIGGIGGLVNSGIDNMNASTSNETTRLQALYQNLLDAERQYKSMKRPNFTGLGIQQQYQNMYA